MRGWVERIILIFRAFQRQQQQQIAFRSNEMFKIANKKYLVIVVFFLVERLFYLFISIIRSIVYVRYDIQLFCLPYNIVYTPGKH